MHYNSMILGHKCNITSCLKMQAKQDTHPYIQYFKLRHPLPSCIVHNIGLQHTSLYCPYALHTSTQYSSLLLTEKGVLLVTPIC